MLFKNNKVSHSPSWELLSLVTHHLDLKTLAIASCVSKSWLDSFSSEDIWQPICSAEHPSAYSLKDIDPTVPYHRLYVIAYTAASKLQLRKPVKPHLSLNDLLFIVSFVPDAEDLFSKEIPLPECCSNIVTSSSIVAEIKLGFCKENVGDEDSKDDSKFRKGKLSVAIMNTQDLRY
ncbi:unnamed protein product [Dovyalis caffra]|uniref:F-box protein n=1 Tax=Dovyalis caffra TaxID=77055 RepID=A0AAV1RQB1_9ROSI|nr:unnamed protein product [Dovyalis caffra]